MRQIVSLPRDISYRSRVTAARNRSSRSHSRRALRRALLRSPACRSPARPRKSTLNAYQSRFRAYRIRLVIEYRIS